MDLSANAGNATFGNIVRGYDSYLKPAGTPHDTSASRKKGGSSTRGQVGYTTGIVGPGGSLFQPVQEEERLFSRSSGTYTESVMLRDRDQGGRSATEDEDEDDNEDAAANRSAAATDAESSTAGAQRDAKRQKRAK